MKTFSLSIGFLLLSVGATANWFSGEGVFSYFHQVVIMGYESEAECLEDEGIWDGEYCHFEAEDEVTVKLVGPNEYNVSIFTVGDNAHMCEFEEKGAMTNAGTIVASAETTIWDENDNEVPAICEVTVKYLDGDTVNVSNNGNCREFCGMRADLYIEAATRK